MRGPPLPRPNPKPRPRGHDEYLTIPWFLRRDPIEREALKVNQQFIDAFKAIAQRINDTAKAKGWWDKERNDGEIIALIHSELSEALEALRVGNPPDDKIPEFNGVEAELADVIIRIMDYALARGFRVPEALIAKIEFNTTRPRMHGNKQF